MEDKDKVKKILKHLSWKKPTVRDMYQKDFEYSTCFSTLDNTARIVGSEREVEQFIDLIDLVKDFNRNDKILMIDDFYPLGKNPNKELLRHKYGTRCINELMDLNYKVLIISSPNNVMKSFLKRLNFISYANDFYFVKKCK